MRVGKPLAIGLLAGLLLLASVSCSDGKTITRTDYGSDWPLTVSSATLHCEDNAVWVEVGGEKYGVNGTARSRLGETRWKLHDIWRDDPNFPGYKVNVNPLIQDGLALCE